MLSLIFAMAFNCQYILSILLLYIFAQRVICTCSSDVNVTCSEFANATFSKDYVTISVELGTEVKPTASSYSCSGIVDSVTLPLLGSDPICAFRSTRTLEIYPDRDATVKPGSLLTIKQEGIINLSNSTVNITVKPFAEPRLFKPTVTFTEDGYQSSCADDKHFLSADYSRYSGYAQFVSYTWGLDTIVDNISLSAIIDANNALGSTPSNQSEIEITDIVAATNESIILKVVNVFDDENNGTFSPENHDGPIARILGEKRIVISSDKELNLIADLSVSKCGPAIKNVSYHWNISQTGQSEGYMPRFINGNKALRMKPYTLAGGQEFRVVVQIKYWLLNNQSGVASDFVVIDVKRSELIARIVGGDRCIGRGQNLVLKAKHWSYQNESVNYQWSCKNLVNGEICNDRNGSSALNFVNASTVLLSMSNGNFTAGQRYQFTFTIQRGVETVSSSIIVTIQQSVGPIVTVTSHRDHWSYDERIVTRGTVFGIYANINYKWTVHDLFGNEISQLSFNGSSSSDIDTSPITKNIMLIIPKNSLSREQTYKFTLTVTVGNVTCQGSLMQRITMSPRHGFFGVMPLQESASNTTFRLRSYGWIDRIARMPFQYRFGYIDLNGYGERYLTAWRNYNVLARVILPSGNSSNRITVFADVRNSLGLKARREETVLMYNGQNGDESLLQFFQELLIIKDQDLLSTAVLELFKSGLSNERKRVSLNDYFSVIEKSTFSSDLALMFADALWEIVTLDAKSWKINASTAVFTSEMKRRTVSFLDKLYKHLDLPKEPSKSATTQAEHFSEMIDYLMPKPQHLSSSDTLLLTSFKAASKNIAEISCKSTQYNDGIPVRINNTIIAMTSKYTDMTKAGDSNQILSLSKSFRARYLQQKCSESTHMNCFGLCISMTSFKNLKYFLSDGDINGLVTEIHEGKLVDLFTNKEAVFTASGHEFEFKLPIVKSYNTTSHDIQCSMQDPQTKGWMKSFCNSNTVTNVAGTDILHCKCSKLYAVAGVAIAFDASSASNAAANDTANATTTTSEPTTTKAPDEVITIVLHGNCSKYLQSAAKENFTESLLSSLASTLQIDKRRIRIISMVCGSIIVNITIADKAPVSNEPTKLAAMNSLKTLLQSGYLRVTLYDGVIPAVAPGVNVSIPPTIPPVTTRKIEIPEFETNWMPLFVSFVLVVASIILISAFVAWLHGRYYKRKRYTDINSNKKKPPVNNEKILSRKQKIKKFETIMEDSLADHQSSLAQGSVATIKSRGAKRSRVGAIASLALPVTANVMMNRNIFSADKRIRELPRLALDESSSESEAETSFSEADKQNTPKDNGNTGGNTNGNKDGNMNDNKDGYMNDNTNGNMYGNTNGNMYGNTDGKLDVNMDDKTDASSSRANSTQPILR